MNATDTRVLTASLLFLVFAAIGLKNLQATETKTHAKATSDRFELKGCDLSAPVPKTVRDFGVRSAAQKGLDFLGRRTLEWQAQHKCMGCHVQGVTGEALSVGRHHQYHVEDDMLEGVLHGILDLSGGLRTNIGHALPGGSLRASTRAFGGAALARYDAWVNQDLSDDLLKTAFDLLEHQDEHGSIHQGYTAGVVARGPVQATYQAIQTWQQAYARSADDRWLTAIQKAESYFQGLVDSWHETPPGDLQALNYALLGLLEAGVGEREETVLTLRKRLIRLQNGDGGWSLGNQIPTGPPRARLFRPKGPRGLAERASQAQHTPPRTVSSPPSSPLATGQTLYALRRLGMTDSDSVIKKGTAWLIEKQLESGGWSSSGGEKGEAMWAVLGLVSTDVLTIDVEGVRNGSHVGGKSLLKVRAKDNDGVGVQKVEVLIDDVPVGGACTSHAVYQLNAADLDDGIHTLEVVATNHRGHQSMRRWIFYAGDTFLTNIGTRFEAGGTRVSFRDIAPEKARHDVAFEVFSTSEKGGKATRGKRVFARRAKGKQGASSFHWTGEDGDGARLARGEYLAVLKFVDSKGKVRQTEEVPFVHDTLENQQANWSDVQGAVGVGSKAAPNAMIELVDGQGNVVQTTRSTASGQYRFKNVKSKRKYRVRIRRKGFKTAEQDVDTAGENKASADFSLEVQ